MNNIVTAVDEGSDGSIAVLSVYEWDGDPDTGHAARVVIQFDDAALAALTGEPGAAYDEIRDGLALVVAESIGNFRALRSIEAARRG